MNFDLRLFSSKLQKLLDMQEYSLDEFSNLTKVSLNRMDDLVKGRVAPTGGEILIFSDVLKADHEYFISNEITSLVEKTETFFRSTEGVITRSDKRIITETLNMSVFYKYLLDVRNVKVVEFRPIIHSENHVQQGIDAALQLRKQLRYPVNKVDINPFAIARQMGIQVYRRKLSDSSISGIHLSSVETGKVILINYKDDIYRQNFSVLHEMAHSIFDVKDAFEISLESDKKDSLRMLSEYRANRFASTFLVPPELASRIVRSYKTDDDFKKLANRFSVNPITLAISLSSNNLISEEEFERLKRLKIRIPNKVDPEFSGLSKRAVERFSKLQSRGISYSFFRLIVDAYINSDISFSKICEVLSLQSIEVYELLDLMGVKSDD